MNTPTTTAAAISGNRNEQTARATEPAPQMFTETQVEIIISELVARLSQEVYIHTNKGDSEAIIAQFIKAKEQPPAAYIPTDTLARTKWRDAMIVKGHFYPELLTQDEKDTIAPRPAISGNKWDEMTAAELIKAVELMIAPEDLTIREAATALLDVFSYTPADVREVISKGEYFNAGWAFYGLNTIRPQIINTLADTPQA